MELVVRSTREGDVCVVAVDGEVDVYTAPRLKDALVAGLSDGCRDLLVDLTAVGFIDSSGLGALVSALRRAREQGGTVRVVCSDENVLKVFSITGLDKVFMLFGSLDEARGF